MENETSNQNNTKSDELLKNKVFIWLKKIITPAIIGSIISGLLTYLWIGVNFSQKFDFFLENYDKDYEEIVSKIETIDRKQDSFKDDIADYKALKAQFDEFEKNQIYNAQILYPTDNMIEMIDVSYSQTEDKEDDMMVIKSSDIVAESGGGEKTFTAEQINGLKVLMPYEEDGYEIYFVGQFNENLRWNGNCLINKYKDDKLVYIVEANYIDGVLLSYNQAFHENESDNWCISNRIVYEEYYKGTTIKYSNVNDINKMFDMEDVKGTDIVTLKGFEDSNLLISKMKQYYYGNTCDGEYNDDTGNAYLISFDDDGYVSTLYQGCFKNGKFHDDTGNAWYITRKTSTTDINMKYQYFKGKFTNGKKDADGTEEFEMALTKDQIMDYIKEYYYEPELKWYGLDGI